MTSQPLSAQEVARRKREFLDGLHCNGWRDADGPPPEKQPDKVFSFSLAHLEFEKSIHLDNKGDNRFCGWLERNGEIAEWRTDFTGSKLYNAHFNGSILRHACFGDADLRHAEFMGQASDLVRACFAGARLYGANMDQASVENADWGRDYKLGDELEAEKAKDKPEKKRLFCEAEGVYRNLKRWHTWHGMYERAGEFHYREWECKRKQLSGYRPVCLQMYRCLYGYGERPFRVANWAASVILIPPLFYAGFLSPSGIHLGNIACYPKWLYYSAASFVAVGYGGWVSVESGWIRAIGVVEALLGVFMMALFLVTFTRKMSRS